MEPGVEYLLEASMKLSCSMEITARALLMYHHFMKSTEEVKYDTAMVAAAALNLSSKVSEELLEFDLLVHMFYCIVNKTTKLMTYQDQAVLLLKKSLITIEYIMQRMLEFTLNHTLAHQYLVPFLSIIFERSGKLVDFHEGLSTTCIRLLSDLYTSRKCIDYKPEEIAVSCIDAAMGILKLTEYVDIIDPWYEGFCTDLTEDRVHEIKDTIFDLYDSEEDEMEITQSAISVDTQNAVVSESNTDSSPIDTQNPPNVTDSSNIVTPSDVQNSNVTALSSTEEQPTKD